LTVNKEKTVAKKRILVVSVGNEFRRDDGAGSFILREIRKSASSDVCFVEHRGEGVGLIEQWKGFDTALLFDAVSSGAKPGTVYRFEIPKETLPKNVFHCSTHALSIVDVIALAKTLDRIPKRLIIYGIEGKSFEMGPGLSAEVRDAAQKVIKRAAGEIASLTGERS